MLARIEYKRTTRSFKISYDNTRTLSSPVSVQSHLYYNELELPTAMSF